MLDMVPVFLELTRQNELKWSAAQRTDITEWKGPEIRFWRRLSGQHVLPPS